jgi:Uma2 family endonuclease
LRAVLLNAESELRRRRHLGIDKLDERWHGEWHFVDPPGSWHALVKTDLASALGPRAREAGLDTYGCVGLFANMETDWRVPAAVVARAEHVVEEGVIGAELVVELYSPGDESFAKLPFYAGRGVTEALIVHRDRRFELFRLDHAGAYQPVHGGRSTILGVTFSTVAGPKLRIDWDGGSAEV